MKNTRQIREELISLQDLTYRDFNSKIIPTLDINSMIGVRAYEIKKIAKRLYREDLYRDFLGCLPHKYFEENMLHAQIVNLMKDYGEAVANIEKFLPYIDNWAVCDSLLPKVLKYNKEDYHKNILSFLESDKIYTIRFGIVVLMKNYLDDFYREEDLYIISDIKSHEYYVNMAIAWYFSYALIKQWDDAIKIIEGKKIDKFVHNKSIQKAVESLRVSKDKKDYLKTLRK